jgi:hypothetical protein
MRALWRTASTSHFFVCKVWIFRSFKGGLYLLIFMPLFLRSHGVQGRRGLIAFSKRGDTNTSLQGRGGSFFGLPPFFFYPPPRFAKELDLPTCAGRVFKTLKKKPFDNQLCSNLTYEHIDSHSLDQTVGHGCRTSLSGALWVQGETGITKVKRKTLISFLRTFPFHSLEGNLLAFQDDASTVIMYR